MSWPQCPPPNTAQQALAPESRVKHAYPAPQQVVELPASGRQTSPTPRSQPLPHESSGLHWTPAAHLQMPPQLSATLHVLPVQVVTHSPGPSVPASVGGPQEAPGSVVPTSVQMIDVPSTHSVLTQAMVTVPVV